jgi:hypothetical protein
VKGSDIPFLPGPDGSDCDLRPGRPAPVHLALDHIIASFQCDLDANGKTIEDLFTANG